MDAASVAPASKVVMKRRKPRPPAVVTAVNDRLRKERDPPAHARKKAGGACPSAGAPSRSATRASGTARGDVAQKRKGLRHFAVRVSQKVEEKRATTYNEVADELVHEERQLNERASRGGAPARGGVDEKNVRRRVYDSLNVLMAMGIIERDRKTIVWRGLAHARAASNARLADEVAEKRRVLERKRSFAAAVAEQTANLDALVARNRARAAPLHGAGPVHRRHADRLDMPFLLVATARDTHIGLQVDTRREDVAFTLAAEFSLYDDREVLRRLRLPFASDALAGAPVTSSVPLPPAVPHVPLPVLDAASVSQPSSLDNGVCQLDSNLNLSESFGDSFL